MHGRVLCMAIVWVRVGAVNTMGRIGSTSMFRVEWAAGFTFRGFGDPVF